MIHSGFELFLLSFPPTVSLALCFGELQGSFLLVCSEFPSAWRRKCNTHLHRHSVPAPLILPQGEQPGSERADPGKALFSHRTHSFCYIKM